jgi:hypothetical protein
MRFDKFAPPRIANLSKPCGGIGNISEHHRRKHTIGLDQVPLAALPEPGEERLDISDYLGGIDPPAMIDTIQLNEAGPGNAISRVPHRLDGDVFVARAVEGERRDLDRRERVADIDFAVHQRHRLDRAGAGAALYPAAPPSSGGRVAGRGRSHLAEPAVTPLPGAADALLALQEGS